MSVLSEIQGFVEGYISEHGHKVWTSPTVNKPLVSHRLYIAWMIFRNSDGGLDRKEVINSIERKGHTPELNTGDAPVFLAVLPAPVEEYDTEYVLDAMFDEYRLYSGTLSVLE